MTGVFYVIFQGQWGPPVFSIGTLGGMIAAAVSSTTESVGDYIATCQVCHLAKPPKHATNRGILTEGFGGILAGVLGCCHSTTSYSSNLGFIRVTKVKILAIWLFHGSIITHTLDVRM